MLEWYPELAVYSIYKIRFISSKNIEHLFAYYNVFLYVNSDGVQILSFIEKNDAFG